MGQDMNSDFVSTCDVFSGLKEGPVSSVFLWFFLSFDKGNKGVIVELDNC